MSWFACPQLPQWAAAISASVMAMLLALANGWTQPQPAVQRQITAVAKAAPAALRRHKTPGAAVGIVSGGEVAWVGGFGIADKETGAAVTPQTTFAIASVTKPVTVWAILKLAERGQIDLDAPIDRYVTRWALPPSDFDASGVTVRRILAHAAGLSGGGDPGVEPGDPIPTLEEAASGAGQEQGGIRLVHEPGAAYLYSSKGYLLLEMAVEEITSEPFAEFVAREILAPLRMNDTRFGWDLAPKERAAFGHDWYGRRLPHYRNATKAQGGLVSTAGDVAAFVAANFQTPDGRPPGRGVISPVAVAATFAPVSYTADTAFVGLGYNLLADAGKLVARKTGSSRGWKSAVFIAPEAGAGIAILTNSDRAAVGVFADIACPWSAARSDDPLRSVCAQMYVLRNIQIGVAAAIFTLFVAHAGWVAIGLRTRRRKFNWRPSAGRIARTVVALAVIASWWLFWYSDLATQAAGYPPHFVTVLLDPWPTAFVWISVSLSLYLFAFALSAFAPSPRPSLASSQRPRRPEQ